MLSANTVKRAAVLEREGKHGISIRFLKMRDKKKWFCNQTQPLFLRISREQNATNFTCTSDRRNELSLKVG
jgi:hypothetical protein